jgi:hypothetical protein
MYLSMAVAEILILVRVYGVHETPQARRVLFQGKENKSVYRIPKQFAKV